MKIQELLSDALCALRLSDEPAIILSALRRLDCALREALLETDMESVSRLCDSILRSELQASSLKSLIVTILNRYPEELGQACEACLNRLTPSTVACGATRGKRETVEISESLKLHLDLGDFYDEWTGCRVWPGACHIGRMLLDNRFEVQDADVIELGSGVGACGISAMHARARSVFFTEYKESLLKISLANAESNMPREHKPKIGGFILDWSEFQATTHEDFQSFKSGTSKNEFVIIGSELIYEVSHGSMIINVLKQLFEQGATRGLIVVMVKPVRDGVSEFLAELRNLPETASFRASITVEPGIGDQVAACIFLLPNRSDSS
jgi:predicted nicotinamide N-methyase